MKSILRWRLKDEQEHRRNRVRELQGSGYTLTDIAQELQVSLPTIKRDSAWLKVQAVENYQKHIQQRLPYDVENTIAFYRSIQKQAKEIAKNADNDNVRVKALSLAKDAGKEAMDLELRGEYVKRAMDAATEIKRRLDKLPSSSSSSSSRYKQQHQQQLSSSQSDQQTEEEEEEEEEQQVYDARR